MPGTAPGAEDMAVNKTNKSVYCLTPNESVSNGGDRQIVRQLRFFFPSSFSLPEQFNLKAIWWVVFHSEGKGSLLWPRSRVLESKQDGKFIHVERVA